MQKHFSIKNFCSQEEVESILLFYDALDQANEFSNERAKRKNMNFHDNNVTFMKDIIQPKLEKYFPGGYMSAGTFTNWLQQVELHTDSWQPGEDKSRKLGYSILVPLRIVPEAVQTSTIIFDQYSDHGSLTFGEFNKKNAKWNIAKKVEHYHDGSQICNISKTSLDKIFYQRYLNHIDYKIVENFSNPTRYVWKIGDAIVWDRKYFHTSETFNNNLKSKLHMIFLINFEK